VIDSFFVRGVFREGMYPGGCKIPQISAILPQQNSEQFLYLALFAYKVVLQQSSLCYVGLTHRFHRFTGCRRAIGGHENNLTR